MKKLSVGQIAKKLNVTKEALEQLEKSGEIVPERDKNGRRLYSLEQLEIIKSIINNNSNSPFQLNEEDLLSRIQRSVSQLAKGLMEMQREIENGKGWHAYSRHWVIASQSLSRISLELNCKQFPTDLYAQYPYWKTPLPQWDFPFFSNIFADPWWEEQEQVLLQPNGRISLYCEELAESWVSDKERHLENFKVIINHCRDRLKGTEEEAMAAEADYRDCRMFFIPAHAVISLKRSMAEAFLPVPDQYRVQVSKVYETIPSSYVIDGKIYLCPNCGWTLKLVNGKYWECAARKCRRIVERYSKWTVKTMEYNDSLCRVKQGILEYIIIPGISERRIYEKLSEVEGLTVELYPRVDACDLKLQFPGGNCWLLDVKDWTSPFQLAKKLKEKRPFQGFTDLEWERALIVIPRHYDQRYMSLLKQAMSDYGVRDEIIHENDLYSQIESELKRHAHYV